jgi:hypothetical protein
MSDKRLTLRDAICFYVCHRSNISILEFGGRLLAFGHIEAIIGEGRKLLEREVFNITAEDMNCIAITLEEQREGDAA